MAEIHRQALLAYPASAVFALINDIPSYPEFLRWCVDSHVLERTESQMLAGLTVAIAGFRQRFTTRNIVEKGTTENGLDLYQLHMQLVEGAFQHLQGRWVVAELSPQACRIELFLAFEFRRGLVQTAFSNGFGRVAQQLVGDFVRRAHQQLGNWQEKNHGQ